jgi:hypothetical protein
MKISLDDYQAAMCHVTALKARSQQGHQIGSTPHYNSRLNFHEQVAEIAESFAAEWAVAKYFDIPYTPTDNKGKERADVATGLEVKWTKYADGHLIVYPSDRVTDVAILVTGKHPNYYIAGWIPVAMAKRDRYKKSDQESWWIGVNGLQPIENLRRSTYGETAI